MDLFDSMKVFVQVAELSSFSKAAENLGIPKASVSLAIQQIEARVGVRLLHRTTRKVQLTHDGQIYFDRCKDLLSDVDEVETLFQKNPAQITGRIRVDMPLGIAKRVIIPNLKAFIQKYPAITIELGSTDRRVDVVLEGFDCVIRVGTLTESGLIARNLGQYEVVSCASPAYIKNHGAVKKIEDLKNHHIIQYANVFGGKSYGFEYFEDGEFKMITGKPTISVNNSESYMAACREGLGIIQVPDVGVRALIREKKLVEILPQYRVEPMPISMIYPHRRHVARRVQVFMDWASALIKAYLEQKP